MHVLDSITPMIITLNEAANIQRTLGKLLWAQRIVVVDSGKQRRERSKYFEPIRKSRYFTIPFKDYANQCNYGLAQINTPWVLSLMLTTNSAMNW